METTELELKNQQGTVVNTAHSIAVSNKETYDGAMLFLKQIKEVAKNIESYWKEPKAKANEAWKLIVAKEKEMLNPLSDAESIVKKKMSAYADEQRRIELEIQQKLEAERRAEADRLMKEAAEAEKNGDEMQAQIQMQMAATLEETKNFVGNAKQTGTRTIKNLVVVNPELVPRECCSPDLKKIEGYYKMHDKAPAGVIVEEKTIIAVR